MSISVCIIAKNEEDFIRDALESVKDLADELIIVIDDSSTDNTEAIAKEYTSNVFLRTWTHNFSDARNFALEKATKDWVLMLDGDEVIAHEDHKQIRTLIQNKNILGYSLLQLSYTNNTKILNYQAVRVNNKYTKNFTGFISCEMVRLFQRKKEIYYEGAVHESVLHTIKKHGEIQRTQLPIHHYQFAKGDHVQEQKQLTYLQLHEDNVDSHPNKAKAYRDIASTYYEFKKDYDKAIDFFKKSLDIDPENAKTYIGLALCYLQRDQRPDALAILTAGLEHFPNNPQLHALFQHIDALEK